LNKDSVVSWRTPAGFTVVQSNRQSIDKVLDKKLLGHRLRISYKLFIDKLDQRKMKNSIAANVIHSLDASILVMTIERL
jgi:DNA-directed RNA polymerase